MKYKGFLIDIDNTIYDYEPVHKVALQNSLEWIANKTQITIPELKNQYDEAKVINKFRNRGTAQSHSRLFYFQIICENLQIPVPEIAFGAEKIYWDNFISNMKPKSGWLEFYETIKNFPICFVTDLTSQIQFQKLISLGLGKSKNISIVTSEETGHEKPHPYMYLNALNKVKLSPNEVCMIGDDWEKDILGATNVGIFAFYFNQNNENVIKEKKSFTQFQNFFELRTIINES